MTIEFNPFSPGKIIIEPDFFAGREELLDQAHRYVFNRENIFIIGERGIGKSSFALQLESIIEKDERAIKRFGLNRDLSEEKFLIIKHRCIEDQNLNSLLLSLIKNIEQALNVKYERNQSISRKWIFDFKIISHEIETCSERAHEIEFAENFFRFIKELHYNDPDLFQIGMCFVIDEMELIKKDAKIGSFLKIFLDNLRDAQISKVCFVLVGLPEALSIIKKDHPSTDRYFFEIKIPPMNESEVIDLFTRSLQHTNVKFDSEIIKAIYALSTGVPYLIHLIGYELFETAQYNGNRASIDMLEHVIEKIITKINNETFFSQINQIPNIDSQEILTYMATSYAVEHSFYTLAKNCKIEVNLCRDLCIDLQKHGYLNVVGVGIYEIKNPLFKAFLNLMELNASWKEAKKFALLGQTFVSNQKKQFDSAKQSYSDSSDGEFWEGRFYPDNDTQTSAHRKGEFANFFVNREYFKEKLRNNKT